MTDSLSQRPIIADEVKCGPEIGVDAIGTYGGARLGQKCTLSACQGGSFALSTQKRLVENGHQFGAAGIIYLPEGRQQRSRTCIEKTAPQANDFIQATNDCTACFTGAQCHQRTRRKVQVEGFDGAQTAVSKLDVREVGRIKAEQAMSCNVYDGTTRSMLPQKRCGGRLIESSRPAQLFCDRFRLLHSKGQATIVREAEHKGVFQTHFLFPDAPAALAANIQQCSGGKVGYVQAFYHVLHAIEEAMKGQVMQDAVRYYDEMFAGVKRSGYRLEQQIVETLQLAQAILLQASEGKRAVLHARGMSCQIEIDTPKREQAL